MDARSYRWVVVAAGGVLGCVAFGAMFSLPVFLLAMSRETGWSRTGISAAMTAGFLAMAFGSLGWGSLVDRIGPRVVVLSGTGLLLLSLMLASRATSLPEFQLAYGVLTGLGAAAVFAPTMATVTGWFETRRSLAVSLVSAGMGMAPMTMAPFAAWLISRTDWRTSYLVMAGVAAVLMVPAALLVRRPPGLAQRARVAPGGAGEMTVGQAVRSPQFAILVLTNFCCCATHSGPIFHTVSYAVTCGIPLATAVTIYSTEGLAGMGGRLAFGLLGDRLGAKRVLVGGLLVQALGAMAYFFARDLGAFYAVAALFGFTYAGVMPLYAVIARENFPLRMMGTVIGSTSMAGSLGMATGPVVGGWIYDTFGTFAWLYLVSAAIGFGAFLVSATFRPFPRVGVAVRAA